MTASPLSSPASPLRSRGAEPRRRRFQVPSKAFRALLAAMAVSPCVQAAPDYAELQAASPAARPVVESRGDLSVAVVFPRENAAQVLVFQGETVTDRSDVFEFARTANYGAAWVEIIDVPADDRFTIHMRTRQTCGPGLYDYRFARRQGAWVVSGLDHGEGRCSGAGVATSRTSSADFLTGRIVVTDTSPDAHPKRSTRRHVFPTFPLAAFEAFAPRYEPD